MTPTPDMPSAAPHRDGAQRPPPANPSPIAAAALARALPLDHGTVADIAYRLFLRRLDPPMTPAQSREISRTDPATGKEIASDAVRRRQSKAYLSVVCDMVRVLDELGLLRREPAQ